MSSTWPARLPGVLLDRAYVGAGHGRGWGTCAADVLRIAFEEFCLLLDFATARTALDESGPGPG
ncbi:hypothetical protein ACIQV3_39390 [Streptomyces sp. NPDC099050]|uniref:hypothetical protein n=1 Tax=Streptomyces sp. NPDC099050 TaxID=3366100 RepID=UPI00381914F9